ncbi:MAG: hypothetical protein K2W96_28195 [Gemmataceae bacterium]|nr:hypothetical protein [Gemmataceae bacterium]
MDEHPFLELHAKLNALAQHLLAAIARHGASGWEKATLDVRYSLDGASWSAAPSVDGCSLAGHLDAAAIDPVLGALRAEWAGAPLYGLLLAVDSRNEVEVSLRYDPADAAP